MTHDMNLLNSWCVKNCMVINVTKTKFINFGQRRFDFDKPVQFHDNECLNIQACNCQSVQKVSTFKYLGVNLDQELSWKEHISKLNSSVRSNIRKFYFLRNLCEINLLKSLYFSLIHSRLQYGIQCYGGTYKTHMQKLRKSQNYFIRIILFKNKRESSFPLYLTLKVLPIRHLYIFKVLQEFYVQSGQNATEHLRSAYNTRGAGRGIIKKPKVNKTCFQNSFLFLAPKFYNLLPDYLKNVTKRKQFEIKLKQWLLSIEDVEMFFVVLK